MITRQQVVPIVQCVQCHLVLCNGTTWPDFSPILEACLLGGIDLHGEDLSGLSLAGADLTGANLGGALLSRADLSGADLTGALVNGADLTDAKLTNANLTKALFNRFSLASPGLSPAPHTLSGPFSPLYCGRHLTQHSECS